MQYHVLFMPLLLFARNACGNPFPQSNQTSTFPLNFRPPTAQNLSGVSDLAPLSDDTSSVDAAANLSVPVRQISCDSKTPEVLGVDPASLLPQCESALKAIIKYMPANLNTPITLSNVRGAPAPFGRLPYSKVRWGELVPGDRGMWQACTVTIAFASAFQTGKDSTNGREIIEGTRAVMTSCIESFNQNGAYYIGKSGTAMVIVKTGLVGRVSPALGDGSTSRPSILEQTF